MWYALCDWSRASESRIQLKRGWGVSRPSGWGAYSTVVLRTRSPAAGRSSAAADGVRAGRPVRAVPVAAVVASRWRLLIMGFLQGWLDGNDR
ncbi:hypothetical protein ABZ554_01670 [Streptomyces sp. NPDC020125]|uniref:hypothetical protein n=1 Tax=Streptomyces sp. NPDC020125 TaxID=3154593 RepID=UPI00340C3F94